MSNIPRKGSQYPACKFCGSKCADVASLEVHQHFCEKRREGLESRKQYAIAGGLA